MPYIKKDDGRREALRNQEPAKTAGELNYQIFYYVKHFDFRYYKDSSLTDYVFKTKIKDFVDNFLGFNPNYQKYNDMTGCLIRCFKEIYRRLHIDLEHVFIDILNSYDYYIDKYEDKKIEENGDVE